MHPKGIVLRHVRHILALSNSDREILDWNPIPDFQAATQLILVALRKKRLRGFVTNMSFEPGFLLSLLRHQKKIELLEIPPETQNESLSVHWHILAQAPWIPSALRELHTLRLYIGGDDFTYQNCAYIIGNAPKLRDLAIEGRYGYEMLYRVNSEGGNTLKRLPVQDVAVQPLQLARVQLRWLDLALCPAGSAPVCIEFTYLQSLLLHSCDSFGPFLTAIADQFHRNCNLIEFEVGGSVPLLEDDILGIENLLRHCSGLQYLWIDFGEARMVDITCISRHGRTLRQLGLDFDETNQRYCSPSDISTILPSAPELAELAVYIPTIDMGSLQSLGNKPTLTVLTGSHAYVPNELEAFLVSLKLLNKVGSDQLVRLQDPIARHPTLHTLRILSIPCMNGNMQPNSSGPHSDALVNYFGIGLQNFAARAMRFLDKLVSRITTFGISSIKLPTQRPQHDHNGHQWPQYLYRRGHIRDIYVVSRATAVPVRFEYIHGRSVFNRPVWPDSDSNMVSYNISTAL
jgi:hypothetical protein